MKISIIKILVAAILLPIALTGCKQTHKQTHSTVSTVKDINKEVKLISSTEHPSDGLNVSIGEQLAYRNKGRYNYLVRLELNSEEDKSMIDYYIEIVNDYYVDSYFNIEELKSGESIWLPLQSDTELEAIELTPYWSNYHTEYVPNYKGLASTPRDDSIDVPYTIDNGRMIILREQINVKEDRYVDSVAIVTFDNNEIIDMSIQSLAGDMADLEVKTGNNITYSLIPLTGYKHTEYAIGF